MLGWIIRFINGPEPKKVDTVIKEVVEEIADMPEDEFQAELEKHEDGDIAQAVEDIFTTEPDFSEGSCDFKTCNGECNGYGWCDVATTYRTRIRSWNTRKIR